MKRAQWRAIFTHCLASSILLFTIAIDAATDSYGLKLLGQTAYPQSGRIVDLDVSGAIALAASGASGLCVYDIADAIHPQPLASGLNVHGDAACLSIDGSVAFICSSENYSYALHTVSIVDSSNPVWNPNSLPLPFAPIRIVAHTARAFISGSDGRVMFVNAKGFQFQTNFFPIQGATALASPDLSAAYVGVPGALQVWEPTATRPAASIVITNGVNDLLAIGNVLYAVTGAATNTGSLLVYDITTRNAPALRKKIDFPDTPLRVAGTSSNAFVLNASGKLDMYSVSSIGDVAKVASFSLDPADIDASPQIRLLVRGRRLYYSSPWRGAQIFEIAGTSPIERVGQFDSSIIPESIALHDNFAYVAALGSLLVYDVSSSTNPVLVAQKPVGGRAVHIALTGNLAYIASDYGGLRIFDLSQRTNPVPLSVFAIPEAARDVEAIPNVALVAAGSARLRVIDTSDPIEPIALTTFPQTPTTNQTLSVAVTGGLAVIGGSEFTTIANITHPAGPRVITNIVGGASWVVATNGIAFLNGYRRIDLRDTSNVSVTDGNLTGRIGGYTGALADFYLFNVGDARLTIVDAWAFPLKVGGFTGRYISAIAATPKFVYTADKQGFNIYESSPPPRVIVSLMPAQRVLREGQSIRVDWWVSNSTNQNWGVFYKGVGVNFALPGTAAHDSFNHWWLETAMPSGLSTSLDSYLIVASSDDLLHGSIGISVEGNLNASIDFQNGNIYVTWPVVVDHYDLLTKTNLTAAWTLIDTNSPDYELWSGNVTYQRPTSEPSRYFQLRKAQP